MPRADYADKHVTFWQTIMSCHTDCHDTISKNLQNPSFFTTLPPRDKVLSEYKIK